MELRDVLERVCYEENDLKNKLFMRNNIFDRLGNCKELKSGKKNYVSESYSYLVLLTYLYRNCKYLQMENVKLEEFKEILGFNKKYQKINFVIKENGVLDEKGFTKTIYARELPMMYSFVEGELKFTTWEEYDSTKNFREMIKGRGQNIYNKRLKGKIPLDAVYSEEGVVNEGTLFYTNNPEAIDNTHEVDIRAFFLCLSNKDLGCEGFYVYSYLSSLPKNNGYVEVSIEKISARTKIPKRTLSRILHFLKGHNLLHCKPKNYIIGKKSKGANEYKTLSGKSYSKEVLDYEKAKVEKHDVLKVI